MTTFKEDGFSSLIRLDFYESVYQFITCHRNERLDFNFNQKNENSAIISIKDDGSGIPKDIQNKIFDPFYTTKEAGNGMGMGLSIVYVIIKKHNGKITVKSAEGEGSEFTIYLPLINSA